MYACLFVYLHICLLVCLFALLVNFSFLLASLSNLLVYFPFKLDQLTNPCLLMTSAARPTWSAALNSGGGLRDGSSSAPTLQTSAKDQPGHTKLKMRRLGQDAPEEVQQRNFQAELESSVLGKRQPAVSLITGDSDEEINDSGSEAEAGAEEKVVSVVNEKEAYAESDYDDDDDSDDDDEQLLLAELEKIKREREAEKLARDRDRAQDPHAILSGNPLLRPAEGFGVKRRWDDDVVFKNQARGVEEKPQKRFINDTTRSDFHRRFLDKFIK